MYAQVIKSDMRVNLIGSAAEGLPIEHPAVICVDIGDRTDVKLYMKYDPEAGEFYEDTDVPSISPADLREQSYEVMTHKEDGSPLIMWENKARTVDEANLICLAYWIENDPKSDELKELIISAKAYIRSLYPDA